MQEALWGAGLLSGPFSADRGCFGPRAANLDERWISAFDYSLKDSDPVTDAAAIPEEPGE
jgi:hypothetical protein